MSTIGFIRRTGLLLTLMAAAATALVTGAGAAQAATTTVVSSGNAITLNLVPISKSSVAPQFALSCGVAPPLVNDNFSTGELSWSAGVQCNAVVGLQGTTVLFVWGSNQAFQFGSQYNGNFSAASSSGARFGIFSGTWGVNNNVLITLPPGFTTTPGGTCFWFNVQHTQVKCTVTTGPIFAQ
ncbi:MAG TPA: hypothetical protein VH352_14590 [Pseudonocardiaceae bacterium]|nr:hypothetical protein [Pseudonocardiaceae bacterium]